MILSDGTTQVKISVRRSPKVIYSLNGDEDDKKSKSYVQVQNVKMKEDLPGA